MSLAPSPRCAVFLGYREALDSRPPLVINVDSPGPAAYSPPTMSCRESSAPAYTFGRKAPPREGGGCRSWQKSWFQSKSPFTRKADFNTESNVGDAFFSHWLNLYKIPSSRLWPLPAPPI
ncbi:protein STPG3 [Pangshura tecta]